MCTLPQILAIREVLAGGPGSGRHKNAFNSKNRIAIDFDGVIHNDSKKYPGGKLMRPTGPPIEGALEGIKALLKAGKEVVIHTARPASHVGPWLAKNGFPKLKVTNTKPVARVYLDDRAVHFGGKTGWGPDLVKTLVNFQPDWKKGVTANNVNWTSPSSPAGQDWFDVAIGICPIPNDHPPSLKNPILTKIPTAQDGWHKNDSKVAKAQALKDLVEIHKRMRRSFGKQEMARTPTF